MFVIRKTAFVLGKSFPDAHKTKIYREHVAKRHKLLLEICPALGYEVGIHNFKNYVLRGSDKYFERIRKGLQRIP
jgi:methyl-accepting chemotaxis protein